VRVARISASSRVQSLPRTSPKTRSQQKKSWSEEVSPSPPQGILSPCFELPSSHQASGIRRLQGREIESYDNSPSPLSEWWKQDLHSCSDLTTYDQNFSKKRSISWILYINYCSEVKFCLVWIRIRTADFLSPTNCLFIVFAQQVSENNFYPRLYPRPPMAKSRLPGTENPSLRLEPIMGRRGEQLRIMKIVLSSFTYNKEIRISTFHSKSFFS
jgi:hypothetical protein